MGNFEKIDGSKLPTLDPLDRRINAWRDDLADQQLEGKVEATRFVEGTKAVISHFFADICCKPTRNAALDAQLLYGEAIQVFDEVEGRAWVQADHNRYVGWIDADKISYKSFKPTHRVIAPRTFLYPDADMKLPRTGYRSMGSNLEVARTTETRGTQYVILASGEAVIASHVIAIDEPIADFVSVAESLIHTPYLWGGDTAFGIDCSGLVGLSLRMAGKMVLRDSDMQAATIGDVVTDFASWAELQRGDLVFWRGHVGICQGIIDGVPMLIHANGHTMSVASEPLEEAVDRIAYLYEMPIGVRRVY